MVHNTMVQALICGRLGVCLQSSCCGAPSCRATQIWTSWERYLQLSALLQVKYMEKRREGGRKSESNIITVTHLEYGNISF